MKRRIRIIIVAVAFIISIASVYAYYTASDNLLNTFTIGEVAIDLTEPQYDAEDSSKRSSLEPDSDITKDPMVTNEGANDAFIFIEVNIPRETVMTANRSTGAKIGARLQELFTFAVNNEWKQISTDSKGKYVFAYIGKDNKLSALKPGETTTVLFKNSKIHLINIIEGQDLQERQFNIPVTAYAIQSNDITGQDSSDPITVWNILSNQKGGK